MPFLGDKIKELREQHGLTLEGLAIKLIAETDQYITKQALSKWERGEVEPRKEHRTALSRLFKVPESFFYPNELY